jgi:DNA-binding NtrC family response regulator
VILARNAAVIRRDHVSMPELEGASVLSFNFEHPPTLKDLERSYFLRTLERFGGNRARTAAALGISERNVYRLIGLYGAELT